MLMRIGVPRDTKVTGRPVSETSRVTSLLVGGCIAAGGPAHVMRGGATSCVALRKQSCAHLDRVCASRAIG